VLIGSLAVGVAGPASFLGEVSLVEESDGEDARYQEGAEEEAGHCMNLLVAFAGVRVVSLNCLYGA
jgi:hypothetical protein